MMFAIDIGGTSVKCAMVTAAGRIVERRQLPFYRHEEFAAFVERLAACYAEVCAAAAMRAQIIGVATPGYSDPTSGQLVDGWRNVPVLKDRSIRKALSVRLDLPCVVENDGVAAALGESRFGAGRQFGCFALLTLGTGVGGAVVVDGRPLTGPLGQPPELGSIAVGERSSDGIGAHLENAASAPAFLQRYREIAGIPESESLESKELFRLARKGDAAANAAIDKCCRDVAQAVGTLVNALSLEACIIGGGLSEAGPILVERVRHHLSDFAWPRLLAHTQVLLADLRNDAGTLGMVVVASRGAAHAPAKAEAS